jgi:hypothetical protein
MQVQQQIPRGDDNQKSNGKCNAGFSARTMTIFFLLLQHL